MHMETLYTQLNCYANNTMKVCSELVQDVHNIYMNGSY